jgi:hypothetical protein
MIKLHYNGIKRKVIFVFALSTFADYSDYLTLCLCFAYIYHIYLYTTDQ